MAYMAHLTTNLHTLIFDNQITHTTVEKAKLLFSIFQCAD